MPVHSSKKTDEAAINDEIFLTQFSAEDAQLLSREGNFQSSFGFSASLEVRKTILLIKNQLSMSIDDVKRLYKAGFILIDPVGENKASVSLPRYKVLISALEILIFMILYFWPAVIFSGLTKTEGNLSMLAFVFVTSLLGLSLIYFQYQRNILPILILRRHGFNLGDHYVLPTP